MRARPLVVSAHDPPDDGVGIGVLEVGDPEARTP
jgi:hypothetical protein